MKDRPSPAILRQLLRYDPKTGKLFWLRRDRSFFDHDRHCNIWNARYADKEAFTAHGQGGVRHGTIFSVMYLAHHVAWALHYGSWPSENIDHENGKRWDNRPENLRLADHMENAKNQKLHKNNKSGTHGVSFNRRLGKWCASITVNYKKTHIGVFENIEDAKMARLVAQSNAGFHKNHGRLQ